MLRKKQIYSFILFLGLSLLIGCAADRHAQNLSKETLIQVVEYDDSMHSLSRVLGKDYAKKRRESLQKSLLRGNADAITAEIDRIAVDAVDKVLLHGFLVSDIRKFMSDVQEAKRLQEIRLQAASASFDSKQQAILEKIKVNQEQIKSVKLALEDLQVSATVEDEIERLKPLFEAARDALKKESSP